MIDTLYFGPLSSPRENAEIGDFVSQQIFGAPGKIKDFCALAVLKNHRLIAGVLYHNWHPENGVIELTSASIDPRWLTRKVIHAMFDLPFYRFGCQLVVLRVAESNERMIGVARTFGFSEVLIPRLRSRTEGEFVFSYTDDQWAASRYNRRR